MPVLPLGEQTGEIKISSTIRARGASKKDASWQFPIRQKTPRQNIPERVKRNRGPVAFEKIFPRIPWLCFQVAGYLVQLQDRIAPSFEYALPTGRGSWCFMHMGVAASISRTGRQHNPSFPADWL
jgi:hypothetical protein